MGLFAVGDTVKLKHGDGQKVKVTFIGKHVLMGNPNSPALL